MKTAPGPSVRLSVGYTRSQRVVQQRNVCDLYDSGDQDVSEAAVGELLSRTLRDPAFAARLKADAEQVLAELDLTDDERATILAGLRGSGGGSPLAQRPRAAGRIV